MFLLQYELKVQKIKEDDPKAPDEDLAALTDRLGLKTPDTLTAALVYPRDQVLFLGAETTEDPAKADVASAGMQDLSPFPEGTEESLPYWLSHALIWGTQAAQEDTVRLDRP